MSVVIPIQTYLKAQTELTDLLPVQSNIDNTRASSIFFRYSPQNAILPVIILLPEILIDNGETCSGPTDCKIAKTSIYIYSQVSMNEIIGISAQLKSLIEAVREETLSSVFYNSLLYNGIHYMDGRNNDGGEYGLPTLRHDITINYYE